MILYLVHQKIWIIVDIHLIKLTNVVSFCIFIAKPSNQVINTLTNSLGHIHCSFHSFIVLNYLSVIIFFSDAKILRHLIRFQETYQLIYQVLATHTLFCDKMRKRHLNLSHRASLFPCIISLLSIPDHIKTEALN